MEFTTIESRIKNIVENEGIEPLPDLAKQCQIQAVLHEQSAQKIIFRVEITNCSQISWPAGQLSITHHWLSNLGRAILYAENKVTLDIALKPGQKCSAFYHVTKQPPANAGGFELRTGSPDTRRLDDAS